MHTDTASCEAYVKLGIRHFQLLRERLDTPMKAYAWNFLNPVMTKTERGEYDEVRANVISDRPIVGGGKCGSCTFKLKESAPFACLTCPKFRVYENADLNPIYQEILSREKAIYGMKTESLAPDMIQQSR